jgi:hypothetical protein
MIQFEDVKVVGANAICMTILSIENVNSLLQSVLFISTIIYTIVRIVKEVKNNKVKNDNASSDKEVRSAE